MTPRLFTREEVDRLIPELTRLVKRALRDHRAALHLKEGLEAEQQRIRVSGGALVDRRAWKEQSDRLAALADAVGRSLSEIGALGGVVKDLAMGLVDFPGRVPGEDDTVNLCWKYGETAVRFWHGLAEGYAQRKPLP
jgi:hypothetical protein